MSAELDAAPAPAVCVGCLALSTGGLLHTDEPYGRPVHVTPRELATMVATGYTGDLRTYSGQLVHPAAVALVGGSALCADHAAWEWEQLHEPTRRVAR